jgi:hypothetical protein
MLTSCKNDSYLLQAPPVSNQSFVEEFDTMQMAFNRGWRWFNGSDPIGVTGWMAAPGPPTMAAYSSKGTNTGCAFSDYQATAGTNNGVISNWLVSPTITMQNGDKIVFYTKTAIDATNGTDWGCRLQLRHNKSEDILTGKGEDVGNFTETLIDINAAEEEHDPANPSPTAYPGGWTRFEATIWGLNGPTKGHFAFRYYLHGAGSNGAGNGVGIDSVAYIGKK